MMTEAEIEKLVRDHFDKMDKQIVSWPLDDAIAFMETVISDAEGRLDAMREDQG
jgi:hypothetical protein